MGRKWQILGVLVGVAELLLLGIPTAAGFYPSLIQAIPSYIFAIATFIGGAIFGAALLGFIADTSVTDVVEGCITVEKVSYYGVGRIRGGELIDVDVEPNPKCPSCQTTMSEERKKVNHRQSIPRPSYDRPSSIRVWECPNCEYAQQKGDIKFSDAEKILRGHFEKIAKSEGDTSLEALKQRYKSEYGDEPSPRDIWASYVDVADSPKPSTDCFH